MNVTAKTLVNAIIRILIQFNPQIYSYETFLLVYITFKFIFTVVLMVAHITNMQAHPLKNNEYHKHTYMYHSPYQVNSGYKCN